MRLLDFSGPPRVQVPGDGEKGLLRATALRIDKERFSFVIEGLSKPWKLHYRWGLWVCLHPAVLMVNPRTSATGVAGILCGGNSLRCPMARVRIIYFIFG